MIMCSHYWTVTPECPWCLRAQLDEARAELAKVNAKLDKVWQRVTETEEVRDEWCAVYTTERDAHRALRAAIGAHNAECRATGLVWADDWLIPLPPSAAKVINDATSSEAAHGHAVVKS